MSTISKARERREQAAFYWSGLRRITEDTPLPIDGFIPAAVAPYRDINSVRHDFPLVLQVDPSGQCLDSFSNIVKQAVASVQAAKGSSTVRMDSLPWHAAQIEKVVRMRSAEVKSLSLRSAWMEAADGMAPGRDKSFSEAARTVRDALPDGELVACDGDAARRVVRHLWQAAQQRKTAILQARVERLVVGLRSLLSADFSRSKPGRTAEHLMASVGPLHSDQFDFEAMSRILASRSPESLLSADRRRRVEHTIAELESQAFIQLNGSPSSPMSFEFGSCVEALDAFRERRPKALELARAISIAELEVDGAYRNAVHDRVFAEFGSNGLNPPDFEFLPSTLVCIEFGSMSEAEQRAVESAIAAALPFKFFVRIDDLIEPSPAGEAQFALGARARRLAWSALSDGGVFTLQTTGAGLLWARDQIDRAFEFGGPALLSVYSGVSPSMRIPAYVAAAAASESRVFPSFTYDPSAGSDWASRFSLEGNAQPEFSWPVRSISYEDADLQAEQQSMPFTPVEFAMADSRLDRHFSAALPETWDDSHVPVQHALDGQIDALSLQVPFTLAVDAEYRLHRLIVDVGLVVEARRCAQAWRSLQELGGIANSHPARRLEAERASIEERPNAEIGEVQRPLAAPNAATEPIATAEGTISEPATEQSTPRSDEPYIETPRCTTCNECTNINPEMFAYNENKQAYIKNLSAGSYAQLVEAAESCQVSIIHPGKPRDPNEPNLDELMKRAAPFL